MELTKNPDAMIMALRKIESRGELEGATSAVMEMCVDNPREGFADLFATHPSIDSRIKALIEFAGGHDPGPLDLPPPGETNEQDQQLPQDIDGNRLRQERSRSTAVGGHRLCSAAAARGTRGPETRRVPGASRRVLGATPAPAAR